VLHDEPAPSPTGAQLPKFWLMSVVAKRLDGSRCQLVRRYRPRPRRHCIGWAPSFPQKGAKQLPRLSAHVYCGQRAGWIKMPLCTDVGLGPSHIVLDGDPAAPLPERGTATPHFSADVYCGKQLDASRCHLIRELASTHATYCVRWGAVPPPEGTAAPTFQPMSIVAKRSPISAIADGLF